MARLVLRGDKTLIRKLRRLSKSAIKRVAVKSVRAGAKPLVQAARAGVPTGIDPAALLAGKPNTAFGVSGGISVVTTRRTRAGKAQKTKSVANVSTIVRRGIGTRFRSYAARGVYFVAVGPKTRIKVEVGRKLSSGRKRFVALSTIAKLVEFGTADIAARPFIRTGLRRGKQAALRAFRAKMKAEILIEARKR